MRSQLIDIKGAGTQKYNGQGVFRTGPTPQRRCSGERCWLLTAAGLFDEGPADNGHDFNIPIHIFGCNLLSFSDFYTEEKAIPLSSFGYPLWLEGCSETEPACQTGLLTGITCFHPAYGAPRIMQEEGGAARRDACTRITGFNSKSSVKMN